MRSGEFTIDWDRTVYVTGRMSSEVVDRLMPQIFRLRQAGDGPITIALNSYGGSVAVIDAVLRLIETPDQNGSKCPVITCVTGNAFSAAATLLAFGNYAVALPGSSILFHDVRYGGMEDVTPDKAKSAARDLELLNQRFALRLANLVFRRLMWEYIDVRTDFEEVRKTETYEKYKSVIQTCGLAPDKNVRVDLAAFAAWIRTHLFEENSALVDGAFLQLQSWGATMGAAEYVPMYNTGKDPGLLDGILAFYNEFTKKNPSPDPFGAPGRDAELRLFLVRLVAQLATGTRDTQGYLETALADFTLLQSINDPSHMDMVSKLMLRHKAAFFTKEARDVLDGNDSKAKSAIINETRPYVRLMWHFCVLLCRSLLNGDHTFTPREALVLGIIDEAAGDDTIQSKRHFRLEQEAKSVRSLQAQPRPRRLSRSVVRQRLTGGA